MPVSPQVKEFAAGTHQGMKRDHNEDCFEANSAMNLWLVADGVGGHSYGEVASALVKTTIVKEVSRGEDLITAIHAAHKAVLDEILERGDTRFNMGSTVVAMRLIDHTYDITWVGDSRAYLWDGKSLTRLSKDHSQVGALVDQGIVSIKDAATHPDRHVLTQSIGVSVDMCLNPGRARGTIEEGQQLLLCSDGLNDELSDEAIAVQMRGNNSPQEQVDALINAALASGGNDNVTVVVVGKPPAANDEAQVHVPDLDVTQGVARAMLPEGNVRQERSDKIWMIVFFITMALMLLVWVA